MSTNAIQTPLTPDDLEHGQIGIDGFGQLVHWWPRPDGGKVMSMVDDVRDKVCRLCGRGWQQTAKSWRDQLNHSMFGELIHKSCWTRFLAAEEYLDWYDALCKAKLRFSKPKETLNEYGGAWNTPWYIVDLHPDLRATLKLGRRKRVDHIEVMLGLDARTSPERLQELFAAEDVTKGISSVGHFHIHAWTKEKREEYLATIARALGEDDTSKGRFVAVRTERFAMEKPADAGAETGRFALKDVTDGPKTDQ